MLRTHTRAHIHAHTRARASLRAHASFICASNTRSGRTLWEYGELDAHGFFPFVYAGATSDLMAGEEERERERGGSERGIRRSWGKDQTSTAIIHAPWSLGTVEEWVSRSVVSKNRVILLLMRIMCSSRVSQGKWYMEMYVEIFGSRAFRWKRGGDF